VTSDTLARTSSRDFSGGSPLHFCFGTLRNRDVPSGQGVEHHKTLERQEPRKERSSPARISSERAAAAWSESDRMFLSELDTRQNLCMLQPDGLQTVRIKSERLQDGGSDLGILDRACDRLVPEAGIR